MDINLNSHTNKFLEAGVRGVLIKIQKGANTVCNYANIVRIAAIRWQMVNLDPKVAVGERDFVKGEV